MFLRLVYQSFRRQQRRKLLAGVSIALGVTVATAMIAVATDIGDKINRELRSYGANIAVTPQADTLEVRIGGVDLKPVNDGAYLAEKDLPEIKGIFWRNNIQGFAPFLPVPVTLSNGARADLVGTYFEKQLRYGKEDFTTGVRKISPWWKVAGEWPKDDSSDVLVGATLANSLGVKDGDHVDIGARSLQVSGVLNTGGAEDNQIIAPMTLAQAVLGRPGVVKNIQVSALTKPEDDFARRNPKALSKTDFDRWFCSPYAKSIAFQLQEAIPGARAVEIRQVSQNEGNVLSRIEGLMLLVTIAALLASALAVSAAMATAILERRSEVGLMKAMGAANSAIAGLFFTEAALLALIGGAVGFGIGALLARRIGLWIFGSQVSISPVLFPVVLTIAAIVTFVGSAASIRKALRYEPVMVLRGEA
ncbi:ABC efflux pump, inner membrane subunit [Candidatus Koribacter versatilis Ellin345]|uniref:ABC efflux pump, inner membrane subunit n=1 Tax=Koribacter versatilis (strain Ellin345) TaxID=204669 RepID=Q1IQI0_KORVE|nr:FtsX-like permease family protein [Candidatus Koribacter versatilis]ABF40870.1 ABC efflux pump, inner membrane subunit [Candidatus Koribacter versatilis Ellin345]